MLRTNTPLRAFLLSCFLIPAVTRAQSPVEDMAPLPTTLSAEKLQSLLQLSADPVPQVELPRPQARRRVPRPEPLTPEELSYKLAVQKLGVNKHRFVHVDLPNRKVRTGVITGIQDEGFTLKDGILNSQWISYAALKAAPRPVPAVGTRIGQGLKWTALGIGMVAMLPLFPLIWAGFHD